MTFPSAIVFQKWMIVAIDSSFFEYNFTCFVVLLKFFLKVIEYTKECCFYEETIF